MGRIGRIFTLGRVVLASLAASGSILAGPGAAKADGGHASVADWTLGRMDAPVESPPDWSSSCGYGRFYVSDAVSFSHRIWYTLSIDGARGYVVDCYSGTDAYFEYQGEWDGSFVYLVWGQLGDLE